VVTMHLVVRMPQTGKSTGNAPRRLVSTNTYNNGYCIAPSRERKRAHKPRMDAPACQHHAFYTRMLLSGCQGGVWHAAENAAGEVEKVGARCNCIIA
jgi:hypothetical protein